MSTISKSSDGGPLHRFNTCFTDDDLKRLKDLIEIGNDVEFTDFYKLPALLARLEAAENMAPIIESLIDFINPQKNLKVKPTIEELEKLLHQPPSPVILEADGTVKNIKCLDNARKALEAWRKASGK